MGCAASTSGGYSHPEAAVCYAIYKSRFDQFSSGVCPLEVADSVQQVLMKIEKSKKKPSPYINIVFNSRNLGDMGVVGIGEILKQNCKVSGLSLLNDTVGEYGASELGKSLRYNETLDHFNITNCPLGARGIVGFIRFLLENERLTKLQLVKCNAECSAALVVSHLMLTNTKLSSIDLSGNMVKELGKDALVACLKANFRVTSLLLEDNDPPLSYKEEMEPWLTRNQAVAEALQLVLDRAVSSSHSNNSSSRNSSSRGSGTRVEGVDPAAPPPLGAITTPNGVSGRRKSQSQQQQQQQQPPYPPYDGLLRALSEKDVMEGVERRGDTTPPPTKAISTTPSLPVDTAAATSAASAATASASASASSSASAATSSSSASVPTSSSSSFPDPPSAAAAAASDIPDPSFSGERGGGGGRGSVGSNIGSKSSRDRSRNHFPKGGAETDAEAEPVSPPSPAPVFPSACRGCKEGGVPLGEGVVGGRRFCFGTSEMIGRRAQMEDVVVARTNLNGSKNQHLFAVFDGHGGVECSRFVGGTFAAVLVDSIQKDGLDPHKNLAAAFAGLDEMCRRFEIPHGTCAVVCFLVDNAIWTACVGDSRAVLCREGQGKLLSRVFKPTDPVEKERIKELGGFVTNNGRVGGVLAVSRALGDIAFQPFVSPEPSIDMMEMSSKDEFLIIACDGVWDMFTSQKSCDLLRKQQDARVAAGLLRDTAYAEGSSDNISTIVVRFH